MFKEKQAVDSPFSVNFEKNLETATQYMKILSNKHRMLVMCKITQEPHSVSELVTLTGLSQPALSHQLAKLRDMNMVSTNRLGKEIYYSIANPELAGLIEDICYRFQCWGEKP